jgi:hypothetical protein
MLNVAPLFVAEGSQAGKVLPVMVLVQWFRTWLEGVLWMVLQLIRRSV